MPSLVGSEMCIRDRLQSPYTVIIKIAIPQQKVWQNPKYWMILDQGTGQDLITKTQEHQQVLSFRQQQQRQAIEIRTQEMIMLRYVCLVLNIKAKPFVEEQYLSHLNYKENIFQEYGMQKNQDIRFNNLFLFYLFMKSSKKQQFELLAPAGDFECLVAAINAGADAVYFGLSNFNMRARAKNFKFSDLPKIKSLCETKKEKSKKIPYTQHNYL
eukprot:TRINITY_DN23538_c0_g1_i2.p1 TRINITY_DN23538_c0_g1~~TRINITY_DN23538_c0_g1_i2.p1  ORF type:complete len:213 (+),score=15.49 TRINITY_DN23538_c0_g1_i2:86-724(+)